MPQFWVSHRGIAKRFPPRPRLCRAHPENLGAMGVAGGYTYRLHFCQPALSGPFVVLQAAGSPCSQDAVMFGEAGQKELFLSLPNPSCAIKVPCG